MSSLLKFLQPPNISVLWSLLFPVLLLGYDTNICSVSATHCYWTCRDYFSSLFLPHPFHRLSPQELSLGLRCSVNNSYNFLRSSTLRARLKTAQCVIPASKCQLPLIFILVSVYIYGLLYCKKQWCTVNSSFFFFMQLNGHSMLRLTTLCLILLLKREV